jgi:hypothetical protein
MAKSRKTDTSKLYAHVVLDRSGSMQSCASDTVGGYNAYCESLPGSARVSLTTFDSVSIDLVRDAVTPTAGKIAAEEFVPRGSTPLLDAVGRTVADATVRSKGYDRVALVVLTDGLENASREFTRERLSALLKEKQEKDGWLVIYLGANQDAWAVGQAFGTVAANTMSYDTKNMKESLASVGAATARYAEAPSPQVGRAQAAFTPAERSRSKG